MRKRLPREREARFGGQDAAVRLELREQRRVVGGVDHDADVAPVLRGGPNHRRTADIDVLDGVIQRAAGFRDGLAEGIEIDDHEVDRRDRMLFQRGEVTGIVAPGEDAAMHFRMQRLDPPVEHLRESGVVADLDDGHAGIGEGLRRAAGRQERHAEARKPARKIGEAGLVGDGQQGAGDWGGHAS